MTHTTSLMAGIILICLCSTNTYAQKGTTNTQQTNGNYWEVNAGYGCFTGDELVAYFAPQNPNADKILTTVTNGYFTPHISGKYYMHDKFAIGLTVSTINESGYLGDYKAHTRTSTFDRNLTTLAPEVSFVHRKRKSFMLYSVIGIGITRNYTRSTNLEYVTGTHADPVKPTATTYIYNVQITPIAIRVGGRIAGFAELGAGYKGVLCAGVSYDFDQVRKKAKSKVYTSYY